MKNKVLKFAYLGFIYTFLYLPVVILIVYSFNNARFSAIWHGATLHWYKDLLHDYALLSVTGNSLLIAVLAATFATFIGVLGTFALFRYRFLGRDLLYGLVFILVVVPDLVFGISLLILYSMLHISLGFWSLLLAHITFCMPFIIITVYSRLSDTDSNIFEAARDLGANDYLIFKRIILPLMAPAIIAGWLLSFTLSMDDVMISFFVTGPNFQILPLYIYSQVHVGITPEINALCTLIFVFTVSMVLLSQLFVKKRLYGA